VLHGNADRKFAITQQEGHDMKAILLAAAIALAGSGTASALPLAAKSSMPAAEQQGLVHTVRDHHRGPRGPRHFHRSHRDRYHGWHRYHSRPHDWRSRRCVMVGPLWMCP
jgi:Ni/Co efflux regulator RcnB